MAWRYMTLRGKQILARCKDDGTLDAASGRVEIRYRAGKSKAYRAGVRNLEPGDDATIFPDDHCAPENNGGGDPWSKAKKKSTVAVKNVNLPTKPEGDEIIAYTDGACSGNPGPCGLGVVMLVGDQRMELSEFLGEGTNNIAELMAIIRACEAVEDPATKIRIFTDSKYSINMLTKGWKAKANKELIMKGRAIVARLRNCELHYVPGHAGVELNEVADQLAVLAVGSRETSGSLGSS